MSIQIVLVQLLITCALANTCALQLCFHAFARKADTFASALHVQVEYLAGERQWGPNWKQLSIFLLPTMINGVVGWHQKTCELSKGWLLILPTSLDLRRSLRVNIVWDQYRALTIKGDTMEKRGSGTRQRVYATAKIPGNWKKFLANIDNKNELFLFLSNKIAEDNFQNDEDVYITADDQVYHVGNSSAMGQCNHEEAAMRVLVYPLHGLQTSSLGMVHTGDTDVIVIIPSNFHHIKASNPAAEIWISFKAGKTTTLISLNNIAANLGETTCKVMALFHAFTGSDSTSSFKFKVSATAANSWTKCHS